MKPYQQQEEHKSCVKNKTKRLWKILISRRANARYGSADRLADARGRHHQSTTARSPEPEKASTSLCATLQAACANRLRLVWENHRFSCPTALFATPALNDTIRGDSPPPFCPNMAIRDNPLAQQHAMAITLNRRRGCAPPHGTVQVLGRKACARDPDALDTLPSPPSWGPLL